MAKVLKAQTTLQVQAQQQWIYLLLLWATTILSFFLHKLFDKPPFWLYILPFMLVSIASGFSWKSLIIIRGHNGEKRVFNVLKELPDYYYVLNDVTIKVDDKEAQIDHLLVSPSGIWSVETKSHLGRIYGKERDKNWTQKKKSDKGRIHTTSFYNPIAQNAVHCRRLADFIRQKLNLEVPVKSVVVFTSADQLNINATTPVVRPKDLKQVLMANDAQKHISQEKISAIVKAIM